jgi:predicted nuclease with TOPRIM domain
MIKYSKQVLDRLEMLFAETDFKLRFEKGNFKGGYCVLHDTKVIVINKFFSLEGKINSLIDILKTIEIDQSRLSERNKKFLAELLNSTSH